MCWLPLVEVFWHMTPTSSAWVQSVVMAWEHWDRSVSDPEHLTSSYAIRPLPRPKKAWDFTSAFNLVQNEGKLRNTFQSKQLKFTRPALILFCFLFVHKDPRTCCTLIVCRRHRRRFCQTSRHRRSPTHPACCRRPPTGLGLVLHGHSPTVFWTLWLFNHKSSYHLQISVTTSWLICSSDKFDKGFFRNTLWIFSRYTVAFWFYRGIVKLCTRYLYHLTTLHVISPNDITSTCTCIWQTLTLDISKKKLQSNNLDLNLMSFSMSLELNFDILSWTIPDKIYCPEIRQRQNSTVSIFVTI